MSFSSMDFRLTLGERIAGLFSQSALERKVGDRVSRKFIDLYTRGFFQASETTRLNAEWTAPLHFDINSVLSAELPKIRARHRWLAFNNSTISSAVNSWSNYAIGVGFDLQMEVASTTTDAQGNQIVTEFDSFNGLVEDRFTDWSKDVNVAAPDSGPESWYDAQEMAVSRWMIDGEVFIHLVPHRTKIMQLEFIDPEALDEHKAKAGRNPVIMGIEVDHRTWKPVAYWVKSKSPATSGYVWDNDSVRVPAENLVHVYNRKFPRQLRGIPWFTAVQDRVFQEGQYTNAQIVRNKIAAFFGVLFEGGKGVGKRILKQTISGNGNGNGEGGNGSNVTNWPTDANGTPISSLAPGLMGSLPEGVKPTVINPTSPEYNYKEFIKVLNTGSGAGMEYGMSFQLLTRNMDGLSFAGGRLASQMDVQGIRRFQRAFSRKFCSPIFRRWMDFAVLSGAISPSTYSMDPDFWQRHEWLPGGWTFSVNPVQEITAAEKSMNNRITTLADECAKLGLNWKTQLRKRRKIEQYAASLGVSLGAQALTDDTDAIVAGAIAEEEQPANLPAGE